MNTLNNFKNQFGQELSRAELKSVTGGVVALAKCSIDCPGGSPAECDGSDCRAIDGYGCWTPEAGWKICEVVVHPPVD